MRFLNLIKSYFMTHPWQTAIVILLIVWMIIVRFVNYYRLEAEFVRIGGTLATHDELKSGETIDDLLDAKHFAAFSALVYPREVNGAPVPPAEDPRLEQWSQITSQWRRLDDLSAFPTQPKDSTRSQAIFDGDLVYDVWIRERQGKPTQIALAFRGTHTWGDWWSNLKWFSRWTFLGWDQYDLTRTVIDYVEGDFLRDNPDLSKNGAPEIIVAGHSLGGGLAHQAAYASKTVKRVYAFNGSAVTGFYSVDKTERDAVVKGMRIYRVGERGEVLAYLRAFMRLIYPVVERNPKILEVTYNFGKGNLIRQHSIDELTDRLLTYHPDTD